MMQAAIARLRSRDDGGFTLVELLVAIVIQGLIMGALTMAFVGVMQGGTQIKQSLSATEDARLAAQYIISDARNSSGPQTSLTDTTSCPDASPPVTGTASAVVRFDWTNTDSDGSTDSNIVNYVLVGNSLLRRQCENGTLLSDRAVASTVQSASVACSPDADCSGTESGITVTINSVADSSGATYSYSLSGTFAQAIGDGPPTNPKSIILLGSGSDCSLGATGIRVSGSGNLRIYGDAYVNATDGSTCKAMNISNSGVYQAGNTKMLSGGSCTASGSSVCPTTTSYSPAVTDPYASLSAPSTAGLPAQSGCASGTAQPGVYANTLSLTGVATCQLASGVYIFQNGVSLGNSSVLSSASGGVLIYITGGSFSVGGASSVNVSAMTSGPYKGVVIWQAAADTNTVAFSNGGSITLNGALYAPSAEVSLTGAASNPYVTSIVAKTIFVGNSGVIVIGSPSTTPLSITSTSPLQGWTVNQPGYDVTLAGNGGDGIYTWSATNLPAGLTLNASTGEITGTPTASGTKTVAVTLSDQLGDNTASANLSIKINSAPSISTSSLTNAELGASYSKTVAGSGGTTAYTWSASNLPAGLSINSSTGVIYGTPNGSTGTSTVGVTLTDAAGATATKNLSLTIVSAVTITNASIANGEKTIAYSQTMSATGGSTPYSWSAIGLPTGLNMSAGGSLTGTPTATSSFTVSVTVTDSLGGTDTNQYSMTVLAQPSISSVVLANKASGGTAGLIEQGDTVTITFSQAMKASTICSAWTTNGTSYSITADNAVTVSVSNASPDTLTVTSSGCNLGSLALGSTSYTSVAATFKGTGANASTITWNGTTTLVITLGAKTAGTLATVASSAPTYTASNSIKDIGGASLSSTTYNVASGKQF